MRKKTLRDVVVESLGKVAAFAAVVVLLSFIYVPRASATPIILLDPAEFYDTQACNPLLGADCPYNEMTAFFTWYWKSTISSVTLADTTNFSIYSTGCSGTVYVDCNVYLRFHPTRPGHFETTLTIVHDSGTTTATLKGEGWIPTPMVIPIYNNFGGKALNSDKEWMYATISNVALIDVPITSIAMVEGGDAAFGVDQTCVKTLSPEEDCVMGFSFWPTDAEKLNTEVYGWVEVTSSYTDQEVDLAGYVLPENSRDLSYNKSSIDFGSQAINTESSAKEFTITNTGIPAVTIASIVSDSAEFPMTNDCPLTPDTIVHDQYCTASVTFAPTSAGQKSAKVTVTSNAPEEGTTYDVALSGNGVDPAQPAVSLSSTSIDFGNQAIGTGETQSVLLTNLGGAELVTTSVTASAPFTVDTDCDDNVVSPNGRCVIQITFEPTALGNVTGTITINDNAPDTPQTISVEGTGIAEATPVASLSTSLVDFGTQVVNTITTSTLTLTNTGTSDLSIDLTALGGEGVAAYSKADGCMQNTIEPNKTCTVDFLFSPTTVGTTYTATFSIDDNAADSPQSIVITGVGGAAPSSGGSCSLTGGGKVNLGGVAIAAILTAVLFLYRRRCTAK